MRRTSAVLLCLALAVTATLTGCKAKELAEKAAISRDLQKRGTTDLMKDVANDEYTPPEDGRLSEAQIQMYLKVRDHEKQIAKVAREEIKQHAESAKKSGEKSLGAMVEGFKALGSAADFVTADIRAAKDLGYNTQEYLWVKQQILAASTSVMAEKFSTAMASNFDQAYTAAKKAYDEAKDEQTKKVYADLLAGYDKSRQEVQQKVEQDPAIAYNKQLLSKYESAITAFGHELAKWEDKPGDAQKSIQELEKKLDEAKKK